MTVSLLCPRDGGTGFYLISRGEILDPVQFDVVDGGDPSDPDQVSIVDDSGETPQAITYVEAGIYRGLKCRSCDYEIRGGEGLIWGSLVPAESNYRTDQTALDDISTLIQSATDPENPEPPDLDTVIDALDTYVTGTGRPGKHNG